MMPAIDRFWSHVDKSGGYDACWRYGKSTHYGKVRLGGKGSKQMSAHRYSYLVHFGVDPPSWAVIMHKCDNPTCVNPRHLILATQADNAADCVAKRRMKGLFSTGHDDRRQHGSSRPNAKLVESDIPTIKSDGRTNKAIAAEYGVSKDLVSKIKQRKAWKHVE